MVSQFFSTSEKALEALRPILYDTVQDGWSDGKVVIITPKVPAGMYVRLKADFRSLANAESLDLNVFIYTTAQPGISPTVTWELGWRDGHTISVYIYPQEVFDATKPLPEIKDLLAHANVLK